MHSARSKELGRYRNERIVQRQKATCLQVTGRAHYGLAKLRSGEATAWQSSCRVVRQQRGKVLCAMQAQLNADTPAPWNPLGRVCVYVCVAGRQSSDCLDVVVRVCSVRVCGVRVCGVRVCVLRKPFKRSIGVMSHVCVINHTPAT